MKKNKIIILLFLLGMYAPSSIVQSNTFGILNYLMFLLAFLFLILIFIQRRITIIAFFISMSINFLLAFFTLISPFNEYSFGNIIYYLAFTLMLCLYIKDVEFTRFMFKLFTLANIINIFLGFYIIFVEFGAIGEFIYNYYSLYDSQQVFDMIIRNKPVLFFGAHNRAAFHLFLFLFLTILTYFITKKKLYLLMSLCYVYIIYFLDSNTALLCIAFFAIYTLRLMFKKMPRTLIMLSFPALIFLMLKYNEIVSIISDIVNSDANGLIGRFSESGSLMDNLNYIMDNPFRPVGLTEDSTLFFGDSGIIATLVRGSIPLLFLMYGGFLYFLRKNIKSKLIPYFLFIMFVLVGLGYDSLFFFRTLAILPFFIVLINYLMDKESAQTQ